MWLAFPHLSNLFLPFSFLIFQNVTAAIKLNYDLNIIYSLYIHVYDSDS
jgi:hypothetical protein